MNSIKLTSLPMCGFIAQLVEHRTGIAEVTGSNLVEALIFFQASSFQLLKLENLLRWSLFTFIFQILLTSSRWCVPRFIQLVHFLNTFKGKVSEIGCFKRFNRVIVRPFDIHITLTFDINLYDHLERAVGILARADGLTFSFRWGSLDGLHLRVLWWHLQ